MRQIKHQGLTKEDEWHPLIIGMILDVIVDVHWSNTRMRYYTLLEKSLIEMPNLVKYLYNLNSLNLKSYEMKDSSKHLNPSKIKLLTVTEGDRN